MKKVVRIFFGLCGFALLALAFMPMSEHRAAASGSAPVIVTNTPLPVQGTVSLGNTPSVNVSNTPSVNVANTPTVNLANTSLAVSNLLDNSNKPIPLVVSSPEPYQDTCTVNLTGAGSGGCGFNLFPSGKRLLIQQINIATNLQGSRLVQALIDIGWNGTLRSVSFPITDNGTDGSGTLYQSVSQHTAIYMDQSASLTNPGCEVLASAVVSSGTATCTVSGYLIP